MPEEGGGAADARDARGRRAAVVFNPTKVDREELEREVGKVERAAGWSPSLWLETSAEDPGAGMAREAVEENCDLVFAVGGDGTIRSVAEGLRGSNVPLGLCPLGTGNLLARNLGLSLGNLPESVALAFGGVARPVDLGVAEWTRPKGEREERVFIVIAGMGLDARIMSSTDEKLKRRVGMLAYVKTGLGALRQSHRMRLRFRIDGQPPRSAKVHTLLVGNCGSIGGNVFLMPDAALDDGLLDVLAMQPRGLLGWLRVAWQVLVDNALPRRWRSRQGADGELGYQQCRKIELWLREPEEIQLDGDHFGEVVSLTVHVEPKSLLLVVPAGWEPSVA